MADVESGGQAVRRSSDQAVGLSGVLIVDKPAGITSHDVVNRVRRLYATKRVGHTGTLDPLATGVLILCIGTATRVAEFLVADTKEYVAGARFGLATDSADITGRPIRELDATGLTEETLRHALAQFRGPIEQTPPMVSAVHHEGKRLYELARAGIEVDRKPRDIEIYRLDLLSFTEGEHANAIFEIECSTGTYIRTLMADIGECVGFGATMTALRRTRSGRFGLEHAFTLAELETRRESGTLAETVLPLPEALADWAQVRLTGTEVASISHGQAVLRYDCVTVSDSHVLLLDAEGAAVAIAVPRTGNLLAPVKVFVSS